MLDPRRQEEEMVERDPFRQGSLGTDRGVERLSRNPGSLTKVSDRDRHGNLCVGEDAVDPGLLDRGLRRRLTDGDPSERRVDELGDGERQDMARSTAPAPYVVGEGGGAELWGKVDHRTRCGSNLVLHRRSAR